MRFVFAIVFLMLIAATSCQPAAVEDQADEAAPDSLSYQLSVVERGKPCADTAAEKCIAVKIHRIDISGGSSEKVREKIAAYLNGQISETDNSDQRNRSAEEIADALVEEYRRILEEMPSYKLPWEYFREFDAYLNQHGLFGVQLNAYSFTGGAHPANFNYFYTFDTDNGNLLSIDDILLPQFRGELKAKAEEKFRKKRDMAPDETYEEAGYWFEDEEFFLPENFKYSPEELLFLYNPYEIAPYAEGDVTIVFDYDEIQNWVKPEYRF